MDGHHHGIDVSWLHHSHKGDHGSKASPASPPVHEQLSKVEKTSSNREANGTHEPKSNGKETQTEQTNGSRPILGHKRSAEAVKGGKQGQAATPPNMSRRGSWISNISSKFSSSNQQPSPSTPPTLERSGSVDRKKEQANSQTANSSPAPKEVKNAEPNPSQTQSSPSRSPGFLTSALRRLSSSTGVSGGKATGTGGVCPRKVMNVDPYRERCQIDDLQPAKLRRVSFSVDVEIAAPVRYTEDESPPPQARRPSLSQLEKRVDARKAKDATVKKQQQSEGEALKRPNAVVAEKEEQNGDIEAVDENVDPTPNPAVDQEDASHAVGETGTSRKKEKKKRSEEERKERKERKRQAMIANGQIPLEITQDDDSSDSPAPTVVPTHAANHSRSRSQGQPTTDPVRMYRRCCQLRETPILKRITDQLNSPTVCDAGSEGIVTSLDLTSLRMPLSDIITFSDWLAIVPVKRLILEDCALNDEAVRLILAGLLAAKTPEQAKFNKHLARKNDETTIARTERLGVIEKLSLKNNSNIGREGWRHISCFIHMSRSLKAIDLSMIKIPKNPDQYPNHEEHHHHKNNNNNKPTPINVCNILTKCLTSRLAASRLEEVVMGECGLSTEQVEKIVSAVASCGVTRLGLANNNLSTESIQHIATYISSGQCEGLDLGGNDLSQNLKILTDAFSHNTDNALYALSLADCNLSPSTLKVLFPALIRLPNFKFVDLSHNRALFATQPNALYLLRKYLPQMHALKRIHLNDVDMDSEHCIALAEILPEVPYLAHLGIVENPRLTSLATAKGEAEAEEACAFYASLMAAVRVSKSIVSLDVDMPTSESSDLVQALGKQIMAYALRNMERGPAAEISGVGDRNHSVVEVPDILMHLVGHIDDNPANHDNDEPAPSEDYIVSGTGVAKALGICLGNNSADRRRPSRDGTPMGRGSGAASGTTTPKRVSNNVNQLKAKSMSRNLLDSARKIRSRLQPALAREAKGDDEQNYKRLQFLDSTLARMIERFEDEYPECKPKDTAPLGTSPSDAGSFESSTIFTDPFSQGSQVSAETDAALDDPANSDDEAAIRPSISRHGSEVSLVSRHMNREEAQMHKFGQQIRRSILAPQTFDHIHKSTGENEPSHVQALRTKLEEMTGEEIKAKVKEKGVDQVLSEWGSSAKELEELAMQDPEGFEKFKEAQLHAQESLRQDNMTAPRDTAAVAD